ncbi:MAG: NAD(P)-binding domain-containing protein [Actinomycetota bacterium]|nr:NAD(P)-binding domain-containing protein [Actinomycetota bacterium]MDA3028609.1 NAD(P)-binding domain-containing protein [Actinomycetota bacterium]
MDAAGLDEVLHEANVPTLLMSLVHLTADQRWLADRYRPTRMRGTDDNDSGDLPAEIQAEIREAAASAYQAWEAAGRPQLATPTDDVFVEMMSVCVGESVSAEYAPMMAEEIGLASREVDLLDAVDPSSHDVLIIGAGLSGVCAGIKFERAGIPYQIIEKNESVGGTWFENTYPGAGVDTPSHLYSYSFAQDPGWSRYYAKQDEIHRYVDRCVDDFGLRPHIRFGTEVLGADWSDDDQRWNVLVRDASGAETRTSAQFLISAVGQLNRPKRAELDGRDEFTGIAIHSAEWTNDLDVTAKRVAIVGTGASAMQIVPAIADRVAALTVFQRSAQWMAPNENYFREVTDNTKWLLEHMPYYAGWYRFRLLWMFNDKVHSTLQIDPTWQHPDRSINAANDAHRRAFTEYYRAQAGERTDLFDKALPDYPPFGKRMLIDNGWFAALKHTNVELVTDHIERIDCDGVVSVTGERYPVDVIVEATGFESLRMLWPMKIRGRSGATLSEVWGDDDARAYLGMTVPDFPNFFCLYGPNTNLGHGGSLIFHFECQVRYILSLIESMIGADIATVDCRPEVLDRYVDRVDVAHRNMIWSHPGMSTWYRNDRGRVVTNSPWRLVDYWRMTREPRLGDFVVKLRDP